MPQRPINLCLLRQWDNGGILIAFESFEIAQTTADKASNYAWGGIGLQVLSNALIGGFSGYFAGSKLDAVITAEISTVSYSITDFAIPNAPPIVANATGLFISTKYGNLFPNGLRGKNFDMRAFRFDFLVAVGAFVSDEFEGAMAESAEQEVGINAQRTYRSAGKSVVSAVYPPSSYKPQEK